MTASAGPALKRLYVEFGNRIAFVTLYVREAHPGDCYPQPETFEQKLQFARDYKQRDEIPWSVAVDDLEGTLHQALDTKPNAAYLIDANGRVVYRQLWSNDERPLRNALEAVAAGRSPARGERQTRMVPMLRGMGEMDHVLSLAGEQARQDVLREVPPLFGLAWLAGRLQALPPLGRGVTAVALATFGIAALGGLTWKITQASRR